MYLVVIAWLYVTLMMAFAEATNPEGSVLGAIVTFLLYGLGPMALVVYLMSTPARKRKIKAREAAELAAWQAAQAQAPGRCEKKREAWPTVHQSAEPSLPHMDVTPAACRRCRASPARSARNLP